MSQVTLATPLLWPGHDSLIGFNGASMYITSEVIDATDEKVALLGTLRLENDAQNKAFSTGSGKIYWRSGAVTWATSGTTVRVGLQGISNTSGPQGRPDGSWTIYKDLVQGTDSIGASSHIATTMDSGSNVTLSTGDRLAIVFDMMQRNGTDSVQVACQEYITIPADSGFISCYTASTWSGRYRGGIAWLVMDDGTYGWIQALCPVYHEQVSEDWSDATNPDERGMVFKLPFSCYCTGIMCGNWRGANSATSDWVASLYSDPYGAPQSIASYTGCGEHAYTASGAKKAIWPFSAPVKLERNIEYCMAVKATGAGNIGIGRIVLGNANHKVLFNGGSTLKYVTRNNGTGGFTNGSDVSIQATSLMISSIDDGLGTGRSIFLTTGAI